MFGGTVLQVEERGVDLPVRERGADRDPGARDLDHLEGAVALSVLVVGYFPNILVRIPRIMPRGSRLAEQ